jgi:hypothetical protein
MDGGGALRGGKTADPTGGLPLANPVALGANGSGRRIEGEAPDSPVAASTLTVFPARRESQRTVCVLGALRGGTSMVAGILRKLGVFMGNDIDETVNEDRQFLTHNGQLVMFTDHSRSAERAKYVHDVLELVRRRNAAYDIWGWKDPLSAHYVRELDPQLRNPLFIFLTRDPGAIAQRGRIVERPSERRQILSYIKDAAQSYSQIVEVLSQRARPTLLVSYERALRMPVETGRAIAEFVGLPAPTDFDGWLRQYLVPDRPDGSMSYLREDAAAPRHFRSTHSVIALIEESFRVRRDGLLDRKKADFADPGHDANELYDAAVAFLNRGDLDAAEDRALSILNLYSHAVPQLVDGPIGVLAEDLAGGDETLYPDQVCGAYYLLGLSSLLRTSGQRALIYFSIAERMMRTRLLAQRSDSVLSEANFWSCVFHKGAAAKAMQRTRVVQEVLEALSSGGKNWNLDFSRFNPIGLVEVRRRAALEL